MAYGAAPFADLSIVHKISAITNPKHEIKYPPLPDVKLLDAIRWCDHGGHGGVRWTRHAWY